MYGLAKLVLLAIAMLVAWRVYDVCWRNGLGTVWRWVWTLLAVMFWPFVATGIGFKYDDKALKVAGVLGLVALALSWLGLMALINMPSS